MSTYETLEAKTLPLIEAYQADLTKHDRGAIERNPGLPFIHFTRESGTHIVFLEPADNPAWPAPGELVPFLFGHADREHILKSSLDVAEYLVEKSTLRAVHYFNGRELVEINGVRAIRIVKDHIERVRREWQAKKIEVAL